jgi:RecB family exonuclease
MDRVLKEHFDRFMEKGELPPELREETLLEGCTLFTDKEKLKAWRNNFRGITYQDSSGITLRGAVDNILVKGSNLIVLDYKTRGFPLKEDTHRHYQLQMDLYTFLLRQNGYTTEDYACLLFYYPRSVNETGEVIFDTKLIRMEASPENGERVLKEAVRLLRKKKAPAPADGCPWCALHTRATATSSS